jgi:hypothetical protein
VALSDSTGGRERPDSPARRRFPHLRLRLRSLIFLLLFGLGVAPLAVASFWLVRENRDRLITEEKRYLTQSAQSLSREINGYLVGVRKQLHQVGVTLLTAPGSALPSERLREPWLGAYLHRFVVENPQLLALRVLTPSGEGPRLAPPDLPTELSVALDEAFEMARTERRPAWRFALSRVSNEPVAALAVPVADESGEVVFVVEVVARLRLMEAVSSAKPRRVPRSSSSARGEGWSGQRAPTSVRSSRWHAPSCCGISRASRCCSPPNTRWRPTTAGSQMLGLVSPVEETGWGVVVHRPTAAAFESADRMVASAGLVSLLVLATATALGLFVSRRIGVTVRRLTRTTHEIAEGSFGRRIPTTCSSTSSRSSPPISTA